MYRDDHEVSRSNKGVQRDPSKNFRGARGVTLLELLCVILIIAILASLLLPALSRAYNKVKGMAEVSDAPVVADMLSRETRGYCAVNSQFQFTSKTDFADKCRLAPKCRDWLEASTTEFVPFMYQDDTNKLVLTVHLGPKHDTVYSFTKGDLSIRPQER